MRLLSLLRGALPRTLLLLAALSLPTLSHAAEIDAMNYRMLIRVGAEQGLIGDVPAWFIYRDKRNLTSHTYDAGKAAEVFRILPDFARDARCLLERLRQRGENDA